MIYLNGIGIIQSGNEYRLYLPTQVCIAHVVMPPDQAYLADGKGADISNEEGTEE